MKLPNSFCMGGCQIVCIIALANDFGAADIIPIYWNTITEEHSTVPVVDITVLNYHQFMAMFLMAIASAAPKSFAKAITLPYRKN